MRRAHSFLRQIAALEAGGNLRPVLDPAAVDEYLALGYVPPDRTVYANVQTLPPGCSLTWRDGRTEVERYWAPRYSTTDLGVDEAASELRSLLSASVERQTRADVEVGAFLSGGLDSSTITALMAQRSRAAIPTFAVGFGDLINELPFARAVAERYSTEHHQLQMDIDVGVLLERMAGVYDEPFGDSSAIPTYLLAEFASQRVKVVLSGDGGDELFGGYEWYAPLVRADGVGAVSARVREAQALAARVLHRAGLEGATWTDAAILAARGVGAARRFDDPWDRHLDFIANASLWRQRLWGAGASAAAAEDRLRSEYVPSTAVVGIDRAVDFDVRSYLPGDILVKVDRASMAHGLECRAPFLDVDVVEFALSLPLELRLNTGPSKEV